MPVYGLLRCQINPSKEDLAAVRQEFDLFVLSLARKVKILKKGEGSLELRQAWFNGVGEEFPSETDPKAMALHSLMFAEGLLFSAECLSKDLSLRDEFSIERPRWASILQDAAQWIPYAYGYLCALADAREEVVRQGANGRRLIGATTRERIRQAAEPHRGNISREVAAPLIAEEVGKSAATVRRMLSELYPGSNWVGRKSNESTDESRQIPGID
jgi:hypothetical protein